tara:strand:- start:46 stop:756 length:711 start_codon:yes stop_codon:yes gene_type:complete
MKLLKFVANKLGYNLTRFHKSTTLGEIIKIRIKKNKCNNLIDIGANVGEFFLNYHKFFERTYVFEPNKNLFDILKNKTNQIDNIECFQKGVGEYNETRKLYITADKNNSLSSTKRQSIKLKKLFRNTNIIEKYNIKLINLKSFIKTQKIENNKLFIKIDTQGNDMQVLLGIGRFIKNVKFIKIEMPVINLYKTNYEFNTINDFMKKNKFKPVFFQHLTRNKNAELIEYDVLFEKIR